ncbi:hypothetical protein [Marinitenerispora sediminis]|uniref:Uncharacterized protein n=1 Tax=Marinitenerispora sediminis TaxID=1931232 RepID=A0A368SZA3_9ACTN|nr:hypothetical protein [Marinitenerispora sediminis]RCV50832.1 hypothetical protein DEF24_23840 [Marinitenerispora sediminis]RCV51391.1 hypothetical protein DEF23_20590 [Marinitenerispora sediminis]RCV58116.1 hypothetical protein DEF28_00085 [Marinitenerispora sediminis]
MEAQPGRDADLERLLGGAAAVSSDERAESDYETLRDLLREAIGLCARLARAAEAAGDTRRAEELGRRRRSFADVLRDVRLDDTARVRRSTEEVLRFIRDAEARA